MRAAQQEKELTCSSGGTPDRVPVLRAFLDYFGNQRTRQIIGIAKRIGLAGRHLIARQHIAQRIETRASNHFVVVLLCRAH
jgi:hypothetical protein